MNAADVATPEEFVVAVFTPPANVPEAPLLGTVNVTVAPLTALLFESFTVAISALVKAVLTVALCGVPPVAVIEAGFIVFLFYANLLMGEFERSGPGRKLGLAGALRDVLTPENFAIALSAAVIGYFLFEFLRRKF